MSKIYSRALVSVALTLLSTGASRAEDPAPAVNPYGPTVTTTASLTNVGIPELEAFGTWSSGPTSQATSRSTPLLIKHTFAPAWQLNLGTPGLQSLPSAQGNISGFGDLTLGLKHQLTPAGSPGTQSLQLQLKAPTGDAARGLSSGRTDTQLTWFYSRDLGSVHLDLNLWGTSLGAPDGSRRLQLGQGVGLTVPLTQDGRLALEGEWHSFCRSGESVPAVSSAMAVLYASVHRRLTLAAGLDLGLTRATPQRTWILGAVFHLGR